MSSVADFPHFALSDDHQDLRDAVRTLAADKIAPHAAEVDERSEFLKPHTTPCGRVTSTLPTFRRSTAGSVPMRWPPAW